MALNENHIIYTAEDIQKYLEGKLAPAEMHAMERAALDDAFLAEAMEGYNGMKQKDWNSELRGLRNDIVKGQAAKVIPLKPVRRNAAWKSAAAILILCSGIALSYMLTRQSGENNTIAANKTAGDSSNYIAAETIPADTFSQVPSPIANQDKAIAATKQQPILPTPIAPAADNINGSLTDIQSQKRDSGLFSRAAPPKSIDDAANNASLNKQNSAELNKSGIDKRSTPDYPAKADPPVTKKFVAQVVGPDGTPLPFANISVPTQNVGTYADAKGNFRLISADSLLNIEIKSAGYITKNITLKSDVPENKIVLAEDELALRSKTFIAGKTTASAPLSKRRAILVPDSVINVEPEDGWNNYNTYITNNLDIPDNILQNKIHGQVEVSFEVQKDGLISNMKIDKSLCGDCDEAALKVIKQGPRWKVKKGNQGTAKVKVKF